MRFIMAYCTFSRSASQSMSAVRLGVGIEHTKQISLPVPASNQVWKGYEYIEMDRLITFYAL